MFKNKDMIIIVVFLVLLFLYFWLVNKQNKEMEKFIENFDIQQQQPLSITDVYLIQNQQNQQNQQNDDCDPEDIECLENDDVEQFEGFETTQQKPIILLFYANWCSHCKTLKPEWDKFKQSMSQQIEQQKQQVELKQQQLNLDDNQTRQLFNNIKDLDIVDYEESNTEDSIRNQFAIKGYPTIILLTPDGKKVTYNGPRTAEGLTQFINKNV